MTKNQNFWRQANSRDFVGELFFPKTDWKLISNDVSIALAGGRRMEELQVERMFRDAERVANAPVIVR